LSLLVFVAMFAPLGLKSLGFNFLPARFAADQVPAQGVTDKPIGGKGHLVRQSCQIKKLCIGSVRPGGKPAADLLGPEPDADCLVISIVEIRVRRKYGADIGFNSRLFQQFPAGGGPDVFIPFDMAAGNTPLPAVGTASLHQQKAVVLYQNSCDAHRWIPEKHLLAGSAVTPLEGIHGFDLERRTAVGTEFKFHTLKKAR
jgi:hypothetical protein